MKLFEIPMVVTSLLGLCSLADPQVPTARAGFMFGRRVSLGPAVNSRQDDVDPLISRNGLELYFSSTRPGGSGAYDIWMSKRASTEDPWGPPVNLGPGINGGGTGVFPESISSDGLTLYMNTGTTPGTDVMYTATRPTIDAPWGPRVTMGPPFRTSDGIPIISPDDLELYFYSPGRGGLGGWDIYVSTRATRNDPWGPPVNLGPTINTAADEAAVAMSPDGLILFFISNNRPGAGGFGAIDTWMTRRPYKGGPWSEPVNLGPSFNTGGQDALCSVSGDGRWAYLHEWGQGGMWMAPIIPIVDFNGDGKLDIQDLLILIEHWGQNYPLCDIGPGPWGDGKVDENDLEVLMSYWGQEVPDPNLVAHWNLDETEGTVAQDSARSNDATLKGDPIWQPAGGKVEGALLLDGVDDYVTTPFVVNPSAGPFSVFAWVKGGAAGQVVISQSGKADWLMAAAPGGGLKTGLSLTGIPALTADVVITDGNWHLIGLVWDRTHRSLYADNKLAAQDSATGLPGSVAGLCIGVGNRRTAASYWSGLIDDVRIYDRAVEAGGK